MRIAVLARIHGRVQGVWFRGWLVDEALLRDLRGWVRNRSDGTVEALIVGPGDAVADMLAACRQGPRDAQVTRVDRSDLPIDTVEAVKGFEQRPTS